MGGRHTKYRPGYSKSSHGDPRSSKAIVGVDARGRPLVQNHVGAPSKYNPELAQNILLTILRFPNVTHACAINGICYPTLRKWVNRSKEGRVGDGFDLEFLGEIERFHIHYDVCLDAAVQRVEEAYMAHALSYKEVQVHHGRVQYRYDEELLRLGFEGFEAYLRDEDGNPIPETVEKQDPEVMLSVLKHFRAERWTTKIDMDVTHKGGVLVVGMRAKDSDDLTKLAEKVQQCPLEIEFREDDAGEPE